jgi:hypothetical protein
MTRGALLGVTVAVEVSLLALPKDGQQPELAQRLRKRVKATGPAQGPTELTQLARRISLRHSEPCLLASAAEKRELSLAQD